VTATFESISSTREEYLAIIERLKNVAPPPDKKGRKRLQKLEQSHQALIKALEDRLEAIDIELAVSKSSNLGLLQRYCPLVVTRLTTGPFDSEFKGSGGGSKPDKRSWRKQRFAKRAHDGKRRDRTTSITMWIARQDWLAALLHPSR
jgi:hypothetical protein